MIRRYVSLGLGVGIIASMAVDDQARTDVQVVGPDDLFEDNTTWIAVRRGRFLRGFAYRFMELCDPQLSEETVRRDAISESGGGRS